MRLIWMSLLLLFTIEATAQITSTFPTENPVLQRAAAIDDHSVATQRSNQQMLDLPFFDDFSYTGPHPAASHWMDRTVFINNTWANAPVSVGVATFDGLNAGGTPYGGQRGSSDTLSSVPLNLGGLSNAYISYYVQAKGLGDTPEPGSDLILEFLTKEGEWIEVQRHVQTLRTIPLDSVMQFSFVEPITITGSDYLYDGFQFRFRNFSYNNGAVDLWHLDYVRVEDQPTTQAINDLAFTKLPPPLFKTYTSVPWSHYISIDSDLAAEELRSTRALELFNHGAQTITANDGLFRLLDFSEGKEDRIFPAQDLFVNTAIPVGRQTAEHFIPFPYQDRIDNIQSTDFVEANNRVLIKTQYQMNPSPQAAIPEITRNDTVFSLTHMNDYYAYDDGSAESAILISELGGSSAMEFFNYKTDSLRGIQIQIPRLVSGASSGTITLKVWLEDLNTKPVVELPISPFFLDEFRDTLQAFTTYALKDPITGAAAPIELPRGKFYIGWEQGSCVSNCVPVGLDKNTSEAAALVYVNVDGNWVQAISSEQFSFVKGPLMLRPLLGNETPKDTEQTTNTKELLLNQVLQIFPNPASSLVNIQLFQGDYSNYQLGIHNALGQLVTQMPLTTQLDISAYQTGIYFLQFTNTITKETGYYKLSKK